MVEHSAVKFGGFRTVGSAMFNCEIGFLKRATALRVRAISESAPVYQRLCFASDPRKNVQAGIGRALRDQIPNWTGLYSELHDPNRRAKDCFPLTAPTAESLDPTVTVS